MYLRPGNLVKDFIIEPVSSAVDSTGRPVKSYDQESGGILRGVIASASAKAIEKYGQDAHPCTHQIVQYGGKKAKPTDRLVRGHAHYYILGIDDVGELDVATIYYVEERVDQDNGSAF